MMLSFRRTLVATFLVGAFLVAGGCSSKYSNELTPELDSYAASEGQDKNQYAHVIDSNNRQIWDDLARVLLLEEPSSLVRYPVP